MKLARTYREIVETDPPSQGVDMQGVDLQGVDLERLDELRDVDPEYLDRVIHTFERTLDGQLNELRDAVLSQDLEALRFQAHRLKGSCANLGLVGAADALAAIQVVDVDSGEDLRALLSIAEEAVATGRSQLVAYRDSRCATDS